MRPSAPLYDDRGRVVAHDVQQPNGKIKRQPVAGNALQRQIDAARECAAAEATDEGGPG